jgi:hypothetical protein
MRLASLSETRGRQILVDRALSHYPGWVVACDGEDLGHCSLCESTWFPGADWRIHHHVPQIVFEAPSMSWTSPWVLWWSRDPVNPFLTVHVGWRAIPALHAHCMPHKSQPFLSQPLSHVIVSHLIVLIVRTLPLIVPFHVCVTPPSVVIVTIPVPDLLSPLNYCSPPSYCSVSLVCSPIVPLSLLSAVSYCFCVLIVFCPLSFS